MTTLALKDASGATVYLQVTGTGSLGDPYVVAPPASLPLPTGAAQEHTGALTDRSGTVTLGGTAQNAMATNASRKFLLLRNPKTSNSRLWFDFGTAAVQASPSVALDPGESFFMDGGFVSTQSISVNGPTTGQAWTAKEG